MNSYVALCCYESKTWHLNSVLSLLSREETVGGWRWRELSAFQNISHIPKLSQSSTILADTEESVSLYTVCEQTGRKHLSSEMQHILSTTQAFTYIPTVQSLKSENLHYHLQTPFKLYPKLNSKNIQWRVRGHVSFLCSFSLNCYSFNVSMREIQSTGCAWLSRAERLNDANRDRALGMCPLELPLGCL